MGGSDYSRALVDLQRQTLGLLNDIKQALLGSGVDGFRKSIGQMSLETGSTLSFTDTEYKKITGNWMDGVSNRFTIDNANDRLYYTGDSQNFLFVGTCDFATSKACQTTHALYKNGVLIPNAITPHTFSNTAKIGTVSISKALELNTGDYLEIWIKTDDADAVLTFSTLGITFWGEY